MSSVAHLFGDDVTGFDVAQDVAKIHLIGLDVVANIQSLRLIWRMPLVLVPFDQLIVPWLSL